MQAVRESTPEVAKLLGGTKVLKSQIRTVEQLRKLLRAGLPAQSLDALMAAGDVEISELAELLGTSVRTLARRRQGNQRLSSVESDRLYRYARILSLASTTLGSVDKARRWLNKPNRALDGDSPFHRLDTELGAREVEAVLGRIEYGVFG